MCRNIWCLGRGEFARRIELNGVPLSLQFWRAVLQEGVEVEDDNVHVVIPGDEVVVPQLAQQRAEHDAGTDLLPIHYFEEIMNVANDQVPFVEESNELELANVAFHDASHSELRSRQ